MGNALPFDPTDDFIEAAVRAREAGLSSIDCFTLVADTYAAPWADDPPAAAMALLLRPEQRRQA